jgi:hypothetical protein
VSGLKNKEIIVSHINMFPGALMEVNDNMGDLQAL